jgi:hypothetical protein
MLSVEDVWRRQRQWSALANTKTATLRRWRRTNLLLVVAGAVLGALAAQTWFPTAVAPTVGAIGGVLLAVAAIVQARCIGPTQVKDRVTARSAAETLRAAVHRYQSGTTTDADGVLTAASDLVAANGAALAAQVRDRPEGAAGLPGPGIEAYVAERAQTQLRYHSKNAKQHATSEGRWRRVEIAATVAAAVLSAVGGAAEGTNLSGWVGVATTAAGAVAAHLASEQHARIAAQYASTADQLEQLINGFDPATADRAAATAFVDAVESVLDRQNTTWVSILVAEQ